jgi:PIN domain nuclease of toxin-antitoxin system
MSDVLVDTQALIWFADGSARLSARARAQIDDLSVMQFASAASIWEMAIKIQLGKLLLKSGSLAQFVTMLKANQIQMLPVLAEDAMGVADLPASEHKDPFDRLIAAQCLRYDLTLVSIDEAFDVYGVRRIW